MPALLHRTTAWLCLVVALLTGVTPANGLTLCLTPDGSLNLEVAISTTACGDCCEEHPDVAGPSTPLVREAPKPCCECMDLPVPGSTQERRIQPKSTDFQLGPWISAPSPLSSFSLAVAVLAARAPPTDVPRPPESVALIRTVVLLR